VKEHDMNSARQYVEQMAEVMREHRVPLTIALALEFGREWPHSEPAPRLGQRGRCFANAMQHARINDWVYVEGWACTGGLGLALEHAWCLRPDGTIMDPTWDDGHDYFGIPFHIGFVEDMALKTGYYGALGNLYLLRESVDDIEQYLRDGVVVD
jgi:hypothetical protein